MVLERGRKELGRWNGCGWILLADDTLFFLLADTMFLAANE